MGILENLQPDRVFHFFQEISAIPRGSRNTKAVSDWCVAFAKDRGLEYYQDAANNVIIIKEATQGYEQAPPIILQGHLDMVCEKAPDCTKDMEKEGVDLMVDGDRIRAKGTTLGGDNGIAVAMALAVLDAKDLPHPRIEGVFTTEEEIGMFGAIELDMSPLKGRKLINIDSEEEGIFTVSCAGGNMTYCHLPIAREAFSGTVLEITIGGLLGGHSGIEIHKGRANANMLLGRLLCAAKAKNPFRLISVEGGRKENAIPREAKALLAVADAEAFYAVAGDMDKAFRGEYQTADPEVFVKAEPASASEQPMDEASTVKVIHLLACVPDGVQAMSADIPGLVQTSLNLGILATEADQVKAAFCIRSSVATQKQMLVDRLSCHLEMLGGGLEVAGDYPAWEYKQDSALRELMIEVFKKQYGREPQITAIHAGLECGMFMGKLPDLDCISIGPDMWEVHTYQESLSISSVLRVWDFLKEVLKCAK